MPVVSTATRHGAAPVAAGADSTGRLEGRGVTHKLFEPFEILRHSNQESNRKEKELGGTGRDFGIWLLR